MREFNHCFARRIRYVVILVFYVRYEINKNYQLFTYFLIIQVLIELIKNVNL